MVAIQEVLSQLMTTDSTQYCLEELRKRPEGLNPLCLESYLSSEDFEVFFDKFSFFHRIKRFSFLEIVGNVEGRVLQFARMETNQFEEERRPFLMLPFHKRHKNCFKDIENL